MPGWDRCQRIPIPLGLGLACGNIHKDFTVYVQTVTADTHNHHDPLPTHRAERRAFRLRPVGRKRSEWDIGGRLVAGGGRWVGVGGCLRLAMDE